MDRENAETEQAAQAVRIPPGRAGWEPYESTRDACLGMLGRWYNDLDGARRDLDALRAARPSRPSKRRAAAEEEISFLSCRLARLEEVSSALQARIGQAADRGIVHLDDGWPHRFVSYRSYGGGR